MNIIRTQLVVSSSDINQLAQWSDIQTREGFRPKIWTGSSPINVVKATKEFVLQLLNPYLIQIKIWSNIIFMEINRQWHPSAISRQLYAKVNLESISTWEEEAPPFIWQPIWRPGIPNNKNNNENNDCNNNNNNNGVNFNLGRRGASIYLAAHLTSRDSILDLIWFDLI